jgi:nucleoid-associated protein YgaU
MRRLVLYGVPGIALLAGAAALWTWRVEGPVAAHPEPSQPLAAIVTQAATPMSANGSASAATIPPTAIPNPTVIPNPTATGAPPAAAQPAASFDVVRVSPQGNAVIAGRALPNTDVVALDGNTVIGRATADKHGEWVILPTAPLPPGPHSLRLDASTSSNRPPTAASDEISITVPAPSSTMVAATSSVVAPAIVPSRTPEALAAKPAAVEIVQIMPTEGRVGPDKVAQSKLAQEKAAQDKSLTVQPGNSLWRIARRSYGAGGHYAIIYSANRERIGDPDLIYPGQIFTLPAAN